jgi:hypothetical protein
MSIYSALNGYLQPFLPDNVDAKIMADILYLAYMQYKSIAVKQQLVTLLVRFAAAT